MNYFDGLTILAMAPPPNSSNEPPAPSGIFFMAWVVLISLVIYFIAIRPRRKDSVSDINLTSPRIIAGFIGAGITFISLFLPITKSGMFLYEIPLVSLLISSLIFISVISLLKRRCEWLWLSGVWQILYGIIFVMGDSTPGSGSIIYWLGTLLITSAAIKRLWIKQ